MITHGMGMQQHSYPSHSKHLVLPVAPLSGFTMLLMVEAALEPGPFMLTGAPWVEVHILRKEGIKVVVLDVINSWRYRV